MQELLNKPLIWSASAIVATAFFTFAPLCSGFLLDSESIFVVDGIAYQKTGDKLAVFRAPKDLSGNVEIPAEIDGRKVTQIGGAFSESGPFQNCALLESITLPDGIEEIKSSAFENCVSLKSITIPSGVQTLYAKTFFNCSSLESITFSSNLTEITSANAFDGCVSLKEFVVAAENPNFSSVDGVLFSKDGKTLIKYPAKKEGTEYVVPAGVQIVDEGAFWDCALLESITLPSDLKGFYNWFYNNAFRNCVALKSILIAAENPNLRSVDGILFSKDGATLIKYPAGKEETEYVVPSDVQSFEFGAFDGCDSLKSLSVATDNPKFSSLDGVLFSKDGKTLVKYPAGKEGTEYVVPENVRAIYPDAFDDCLSLESILVAAENPNLRSVDGVLFSADSKLLRYPAGKKETEYVVPQWVNRIGVGAFSRCRALEVATVASHSITIDASAFRDCVSLKQAHLPRNIRLWSDAFAGCPNVTLETTKAAFSPFNRAEDPERLAGYDWRDDVGGRGALLIKAPRKLDGTVEIPAQVGGKQVTNIVDSDFWNGCQRFLVAENNPNFRSIDGVLFSKNGKTLIKYPAKKEGTKYVVPQGVGSIAFGAFRNCAFLKSVSLPTSLQSLYDKFRGCALLESISVATDNPRFDSVDGVLFSKDGKTLVRCPAGKNATEYVVPQGVATISFCAFEDCALLKSIKLPPSVRTVGDYAFAACVSLESATLPPGVQKLGESAFWACVSLKSLKLPEGFQAFGKDALSGCASLKSLELPTSLQTLDKDAFWGCDSLESVSVAARNPRFKSIDGVLFSKDGKTLICHPAGKKGTEYVVPTGVKTLGGFAFAATSFQSLTLPNSLETIEKQAFQNCRSLKSLTIPEGVKTIERWAFANCDALESITLPDSLETIDANAFEHNFFFKRDVELKIVANPGTVGAKFAEEREKNIRRQ